MSWEQWRGEIAKACDGSHHTIESIEQSIREGRALPLYAPGCCFVVEVHDYPNARACQVTWAAGTLESIIAAAPDLHAWARSHGCTEMLVEGHPAWQRALKPVGYEVWSVTLRMPLHGPV